MRNRAIALLGIAVLASSCSKAPQQAPPPLSVDVAKASQRDIATYMTLDGQITPFLDSTLASSQSGTLAGVYVNEGDVVHKGELLAKLDDSQLQAQLAANEATVAQSASKVTGSQIQAPISSQGYTTTVNQAEAKLATDKAALVNAQLVYNSNNQLVKQGYVSQTTMELARSNYVAAQQQISNDEAALRAAKSGLQSTQVDQATIQQRLDDLAFMSKMMDDSADEVSRGMYKTPRDAGEAIKSKMMVAMMKRANAASQPTTGPSGLAVPQSETAPDMPAPSTGPSQTGM